MSRTGSKCLIVGLFLAASLALNACGGGSSVENREFPSATPGSTPATESRSNPVTPVTGTSPEENGRTTETESPLSRRAGAGAGRSPATSPPLPTATKSTSQGPVLGSAGAYVEGVGEKQAIMSSIDHVDLNADPSDDIVAYNAFPPTSGDHWSTPVLCGFYIHTVPDEMVVHNLEHSNIVVSYNLTTREDQEALKSVYDDLPEVWREHFTVVRPYGRISEGKVALTAWGVIDEMAGVDAERIMRFFEHYVGKLGPEGPISCRGSQGSMPRG